MTIQRKTNCYQKNKNEVEENAKGQRSTCDRQMHIAKFQEKKDKLKHVLGGLQEGL